jgi:hydroxypyruvate isomerase
MPRFSANLSFLFTELEFLDRFKAARDAGFDAVEFMFPYLYKKERLAEVLNANGLELVLHNLPAGNWEAGERGIACHPDRKKEFQEGVQQAVDYAKALGCRRVNCLAGIRPPEIGFAEARDALISNLVSAAQTLSSSGVRLLLEPVNTVDVPGFFVSTSAFALELIKAADPVEIGLQFDVYHAQVMEGNIARTIESNLKQIFHIQIADNPGRHEPETGEINYPFLFALLDRVGYSGWVGCEYKPLRDTLSSLGWLKGEKSNLWQTSDLSGSGSWAAPWR